MSIREKLVELDRIKQEIKNLNLKRRTLLNRQKEIYVLIDDFLKEKDQPGMRYNGKAIILSTKQVNKRLPPKDKDKNVLDLLQKYNISDPERMLEELKESMKGEAIIKREIKIKRDK